MANVDGLKDQMRERGQQLHEAGVEEMLALLDVSVPDSGEAHAGKLRDTRRVTTRNDRDRFAAVITYPTENASWQEKGTEPHEITPRGTGYPLKFYWPRIGSVARFARVMHPGSHKNDGWFSDTLAKWSDALAAGARSVR